MSLSEFTCQTAATSRTKIQEVRSKSFHELAKIATVHETSDTKCVDDRNGYQHDKIFPCNNLALV